MSLYVLDTDSLTLYQRGHAGLHDQIKAHATDQLAITVISVEEQLSGWYTLLRAAKNADHLASAYDRLAQAVATLAALQILSFSKAAILRYEQLKALNVNIGKMDLRIAAITQEHGGVLVSRNTKDFARVPGLGLENWID